MINWLLLFIPISTVFYLVSPDSHIAIFVTGALAIVPLADFIRKATESIATASSPAVGGLVNVTFGNAPDFILAIFVLMNGHVEVVKAQLAGGIIGNGLLGLGIATIIGTWGKPYLTFDKERAGLLSSLLVLSMLALATPVLFEYTERHVLHEAHTSGLDEHLSLVVSIILILVYAGNLLYSFVTHRKAFGEETEQPNEAPRWSLRKAAVIITVATVFLGWESDIISGSLDKTAAAMGLTPFFLGVVVLALLGCAAEYISAAYFARKGDMGLALSITAGATVQIALLIAPLLVIISYFFPQSMDLVFNDPIELIGIAGVAFTVNSIAHDGRVTWFEGVMLVAVYLIFATAFYLTTAAPV